MMDETKIIDDLLRCDQRIMDVIFEDENNLQLRHKIAEEIFKSHISAAKADILSRLARLQL